MSFGARLRAARLAAGHRNATTFAELIGIRPNSVYRIENGHFEPSRDTLAAWARTCGVTMESLLHGDSTAPEAAE